MNRERLIELYIARSLSTFKELSDSCLVEAISNKFNPTHESAWRGFCRAYSIKYSTELSKVLGMDPYEVILSVYEGQLDGQDVEEYAEKYLDTIYSIEDPNYEKEKDEDFANFTLQAEEEERIKKEGNQPKETKEVPKQGFLDMSKFSGLKDES